MTVSTVAQLGIPGGVEMLVVLLIGVLLFGAQKIPETQEPLDRRLANSNSVQRSRRKN